jgi:hypothetical protein
MCNPHPLRYFAIFERHNRNIPRQPFIAGSNVDAE